MAQFELTTEWRIRSSLGKAWEALSHSERWPQWWRGLECVVELDAGGKDGIGNLRRFSWKGMLPYQLTVDIRTTRIEPLRLIEGVASGDVTGVGIWVFAQEDELSVIRFTWNVRMETFWMKILACAARQLVCWNHYKVME